MSTAPSSRSGRPPVLWTTKVAVLAFTLIGSGLSFQSTRFSRTPAYGNLLRLFHAQVWGAVYLVLAALLLAWALAHLPVWYGIAVHTVAIMLSVGWLLAFVVRWITDDSTTIVNVVSWTVLSTLLAESAISVEDERERAR